MEPDVTRLPVDEDGTIWLPTGDAFVSLHEAGKTVSGAPRCDGLEFWHVIDEDGTSESVRTRRDKAKAAGQL